MEQVIIAESGMQFGPFLDTQVFQIEKSSVYVTRFLPQGIKICEFILMRNKTIYFIEAKKSCPNHHAAMSNQEKREKYDEYIHDISQKMRDSLNLYASILLQNNLSSELSEEMRNPDLSDLKIRFMLVVKDAQPEWLIHYPDIFQDQLRNEMKIWNIPSFIVLTGKMARKKGFLVPEEEV